MKTNNLFVVLKPSSSTDSMGGDMPWVSYSYLTSNGFSCDVNDAEIFDSHEQATQALQRCVRPYFRVETLKQAIEHAVNEAYDRGVWEEQGAKYV